MEGFEVMLLSLQPQSMKIIQLPRAEAEPRFESYRGPDIEQESIKDNNVIFTYLINFYKTIK